MTDLDDEIRAAFTYRASTTTTSPETATVHSQLPHRSQQLHSPHRTARYVGVAAALILVIGGLAAVNRGNDEVSPLDSVAPTLTTGATSTSQPPSTLSSGTVSAEFPYTDLDYATTESWLPQWPEVNASEPAATTFGYGLNLCDDGYATKVMRVEPTEGPPHTYSGTLCVFIELAQQRVQATTSCATTTAGRVDALTYARCQRRTVLTDTAGAGTAVTATASDAAQAQLAAFPGPTRYNQPEPFDPHVASAAGATVDFGTVSVNLSTSSGRVCAEIKLPEATANGCANEILMSTGLAYGAFQDGDGPIELVGIVPDDITSVQVGDTVLTPTSNVWHYTATPGKPLTITVQSASGTTASTS